MVTGTEWATRACQWMHVWSVRKWCKRCLQTSNCHTRHKTCASSETILSTKNNEM